MALAPVTASPASPSPRAPRPVPQPFGPRPLRTFALFVALPVFLFYVASAGLVIYVLGAMTHDIDRLEDSRGIAAMHAALDSFVNDLSGSVADEGTWDEAYLNVVVTADPGWMDQTWGATARLGQTYDAVFVTDQSGAIIYGEDASSDSPRGNIADRFPAALTMLSDLDKAISSTGDATTVSRYAADKAGLAALAAISIHKAAPGGVTVPETSRRVLWIARHITPSILQDIAARYQTPLATLVANPMADESSIDLTDADGHRAGTVAWPPDRPGDAAYGRALAVATGFFFLVGAALVVGLGILRRAMVERAQRVETVFTSIERARAAAEAAPVVAAEAEGAVGTARGPESPIDNVNAADFSIEYQPIFDLRGEAMVGAEALLRWRKPDGTRIPQESLSPLQTAALLDRIGIIAVRRAADEIAPLLGVSLTVSVTPNQLLTPVFAEKIAATLGATNLPAHRLQLAVSTDLLRIPPNELRAALADLHRHNVGIALGDFAIGALSIAYAAPALANRIRLPRSMTRNLDTDAGRVTVLEATLAVAKTMNWAITAPFVERKQDAAKLLRLGCREFEGHLFAEPMSIAALTALVLKPAAKVAS